MTASSTNDTAVRTGSCLCGAVRYSVGGPMRGIVACHCSQCRRQSGHHVAATRAPAAALQIEGGEAITWYRASETARRGFCRHCGSQLFWQPDHGKTVSIFAGTLDSPTGLKLEKHIFVADKSDYYEIADGLQQFDKSDS
ncbi:MAG: GFA family protein [Hyphomicrobiales bacterium]|nr:GFA family protein [Hyphomicrobiales bacterium]